MTQHRLTEYWHVVSEDKGKRMQAMERAYQQIWIVLIRILQPMSTLMSTHDSLIVILTMLVDFLSIAHLAALVPIDVQATVRILQPRLFSTLVAKFHKAANTNCKHSFWTLCSAGRPPSRCCDSCIAWPACTGKKLDAVKRGTHDDE